MTPALAYSLCGAALFTLGAHAFFVQRHLVRRIIALNVMGSGVFLVLGAMAGRGDGPPDPVPLALVITGIVVAVAMTALGLGITVRLFRETGRVTVDADEREDAQRGAPT